jgi:hypothetical protein
MTTVRILRTLAAALALPLTALPVLAQSGTDWETREQDAMWVGAYLEQPVGKTLSLWFDGQWRRMDLGARPQQLLLRPGVYLELAPGVKVGGGYAYIATAPYGTFPIPSPLREHRAWQDLLLSHPAGSVGVSHRFRLEQRWVNPVVNGVDGPTTYANRIRYRARGNANLGTLAIGGQPVYGFAWNELLMPLGGTGQRFTIGQNRATAGIGFTLSGTMKTEVGYMNLYNAYPSRRANEVNHTLWLSWHYTGRRAPSR